MSSLQAEIDLHMHSFISDGTDSPEALLMQVREAGLRIFSVTDHDAIAAGQLLPALLHSGDPSFIPGVEFSCKDELGKYHILGYGYRPDAPAIQAAVEHGHSLRIKKLEARLLFLQQAFGFDLPAQELQVLRSMHNPGKPHIGNLLVKLGYAKTKEEAIARFINPAKTAGASYLRPEEAISAILSSGGVPVLAHPCFGSGEQLILGPALKQRVLRLMELGLQGLEAFYSGFSPAQRAQVLTLCDELGLFVTAGSDYHGANKAVRLGDTGLQPGAPRPAGLERFLQRVGRG